MSATANYKRNLILGSVFSMIILLITSFFSYLSIQNLLKSQALVQHTSEIMFNLEQIISATKDAETGQRGYLLTGNSSFLEPYQGAREKAWEAYDKVSFLTADNAEQQKDMPDLAAIIKNRFILLEASVEKKSKGIPIDTAKLNQGRLHMRDLRVLISTMESREKKLLASRNSVLGFYSEYTPWIIIVASLAAVIVTIIFFLRLSSDYNQRIKMEYDLKRKEDELQKRMETVSAFAESVAGGDYQKRIDRKDLEL